jgi:quercetin dioxygenase-like cupin family protein
MISTVFGSRRFAIALVSIVIAFVTVDPSVAAGQDRTRPTPTLIWAPKPTSTPAYAPPQKPWVKLTDVKARHQRDANWRELIVDDGRLTGEYVAAAAGTKTDRRFHPDTREWFAVVEGEVKVEIEGQPPITATRGSLVNIPRQTMYTVETIGEKPSLRFVVNVAKAKTLYPQEVKPPAAPAGMAGCRSESIACPGSTISSTCRTSTSTRPRRRTISTPAADSCATTSPRC